MKRSAERITTGTPLPLPRPSIVISASTWSPFAMNRSGFIWISSQAPNQRSKKRPDASRPS